MITSISLSIRISIKTIISNIMNTSTSIDIHIGASNGSGINNESRIRTGIGISISTGAGVVVHSVAIRVPRRGARWGPREGRTHGRPPRTHGRFPAKYIPRYWYGTHGRLPARGARGGRHEGRVQYWARGGRHEGPARGAHEAPRRWHFQYRALAEDLFGPGSIEELSDWQRYFMMKLIYNEAAWHREDHSGRRLNFNARCGRLHKFLRRGIALHTDCTSRMTQEVSFRMMTIGLADPGVRLPRWLAVWRGATSS